MNSPFAAAQMALNPIKATVTWSQVHALSIVKRRVQTEGEARPFIAADDQVKKREVRIWMVKYGGNCLLISWPEWMIE